MRSTSRSSQLHVRCTHSTLYTACAPRRSQSHVKSKLLPASKLKLSSHIHVQSRVAHHTPKHHAKRTPTIPPHNNNHPPGHLTSQSHTPPQHIPPKSRRQCSAARSRPPCADRSTRVSVPLQPLRRPLPSPSAHSPMLLVFSTPLGVPGRPSASPAVQSSVP